MGYDFVLVPICQPYVSSKIGPEWPPLTPSDSEEVAYFLSIPFICAHFQRGQVDIHRAVGRSSFGSAANLDPAHDCDSS